MNKNDEDAMYELASECENVYEAIKFLRRETGLTLVECKDLFINKVTLRFPHGKASQRWMKL